MNFSRFWDRLKKSMAEEAEAASTKLSNGGCVNMEEYRQTVGYIRGINFALGEARHILGEDELPNQPLDTEDD